MLSVFLAGNYGDVDTAIAMCNNLDEEFATYLPHLAKATKIERWREHAQFFLGKCDCVLKLKDQCVASIYDVKLAQEQNIPVFNNYTELLQFSREGL